MPFAPGRSFYLRAGDRLPILQGQIVDGGGAAVNLNDFENDGYYTVTLKIRRADLGAVAVSRTMTLVSPTEGVVSYSWVAGDVATAGRYLMEIVVTDAEETFQKTFPTDGYLVLDIAEAL